MEEELNPARAVGMDASKLAKERKVSFEDMISMRVSIGQIYTTRIEVVDQRIREGVLVELFGLLTVFDRQTRAP